MARPKKNKTQVLDDEMTTEEDDGTVAIIADPLTFDDAFTLLATVIRESYANDEMPDIYAIAESEMAYARGDHQVAWKQLVKQMEGVLGYAITETVKSQ